MLMRSCEKAEWWFVCFRVVLIVCLRCILLVGLICLFGFVVLHTFCRNSVVGSFGFEVLLYVCELE